ncbi:putative uncharacterized protein [Firmicutes bacterium CAG:449]|nr:putative uncharacterized protein [Firmicutes bacterium CAG:449]
MKRIPVFMINGFLEAGKTEFILATIRRDEFYKRGTTLLLVCEEGEIEYDLKELEKYKVTLQQINEGELNANNLDKIIQEGKYNRVVIEMNCMFDENTISFPKYFDISQIITIIDGITFPTYFANMRQKFVDMIKISDVVAFNKLKDNSSLQPFDTALKMINNQCLFCIIDEDCISLGKAFETPLPYNLKEKEIEIKDDDFGIFYIDTFDNRNHYENKIVTFNAWVVKSNKLKEGEFIAGRKVLTCCANDIQLYGFLVTNSLNQNLKDDSWVKIKATCKVEYNKEYDEEELVLYPIELTPIKPIKNEILDLSK